MSSYRRIRAVALTATILDAVAMSEGITGKEVADQLQEAHGTVMSHLATLEDAGLVREVGGRFQIGMKLGLYWARKRANKEAERERINHELELLGT